MNYVARRTFVARVLITALLRAGVLLTSLALFTVGYAFAGNSTLRSPWDSYPVTANDVSYSCPDAQPLPRDFATNSYLIDAQHSIADPILQQEHQESVSGIEDFSRAVVKAADTFRTKGSRAAAECVVSLLESAANQGALAGTMNGHQAVYTQGSNLGAWAIAYLKVRGGGVASPEQNKKITAWLKKLAKSNRDYYNFRRSRRRPNDGSSHLLYWAGFEVAATAIANDDHGLFRWAMDAYKQGVGDIREDGSLPMEMERGQLSLNSHLRALAALVMLAEFGEVNGIDLYAEHDSAITRLIAFCVTGLEDPSSVEQETGVMQATPPEIQPWEISWAQPYTHRFPNPKLTALLSKAPRLNYTMLGGLPPE
jgi:poly(beta-D-mannuronate) lyase